jgi:hypothetical protein
MLRVTSCWQVRVAGDDAEDARRSMSENMRLERRRRLLAEAELSAKAHRPSSFRTLFLQLLFYVVFVFVFL